MSAAPRPIRTLAVSSWCRSRRQPTYRPDPALDDWLGIRPTGPGALFTRVIYPGRVTNERIGPRAVGRLVQERAIAAGSMAFRSPATRCVPDTPPQPPSTVPRSTESPPRPGTATSAPCSTTTSDQQKPSRRRPAATSACDPRRAERVGVKGFWPHRLRYTAAHRFRAASGSESGLMAIAGWRRADMLVRYDRARV
jgi:hypothetical protein